MLRFEEDRLAGFTRGGAAAQDAGLGLDALQETARRITANIERVIEGKSDVVRLSLVVLLAEGHLLIEDVPGVGKTTLARALAACVRGQWRRIQFTPDLLPADVSGVTIFNQASRGFEFHPGPVFANIVIADEINRASPKTQSALLEVMEERQVTVDAVPHPVPQPFMVIATQNPVDLAGTYALPEAQLDRFLLRTSIGYPAPDVEEQVLTSRASLGPVDVRPVASLDDVREHRARVEDERAVVLAVDGRAGDVGGQQVRGEGDALHRAVEAGRQRPCQRRLAGARHVLDEQVALGQQGYDGQPHGVGPAAHDPPDVVDEGLRGARHPRQLLLVHPAPPRVPCSGRAGPRDRDVRRPVRPRT